MYDEKKLILDYWVGRLKDLPLPPKMPIEQRLTMLQDGTLSLNLTSMPLPFSIGTSLRSDDRGVL